jgi:cytochrome P450 / NADPH-cytochrome P450 reductase
MHDIASQMVMKWARQGPEKKILLTDDFTRLTLDTIALCAMDYRFNSFYSDDLDPYVVAMSNTLHTRSERGQIGGMIRSLLPGHQKKLQQDAEYMSSVAAKLVQHRRDNPSEKKDLLNAMINGRDPKTGQGMRDELIAANMQTFLIAGEYFFPSWKPCTKMRRP